MRTPTSIAMLAAAVIAAAGCSGVLPGSDGEEGGGQVPAGKPPKYDEPLTKEAWSGIPPTHTKLEMKQVERHGDRSVLRFFVTPLDEKSATRPGFGTCVACSGPDFYLIDPVGRKAYYPHRDSTSDPIGSEPPYKNHPGVRYEAVLHFSKLPENVNSMTVVTPSTAGEFTGVPVTGGKGSTGPAAPTPSSLETPKAGSTKAWPMNDNPIAKQGGVYDMFGITEGEVKSSTSSGTDETIGLRTDVLFAFDSANLSPRAKAILDDVAAETRRRADPAKPPINVEGHTDGRGTPDYNLGLSQRRGEAVRRELQARLGGGYRYQTAGKAETEPIAKEGGADDEQARQKNRRVEISYKIKQRSAEDGDDGGTSTGEGDEGGGGRPARFRAADGKTVASRTADFTNGRRRLDIKPMYRDGAYLVVPFEITNLGPRELTALDDYGQDITGHRYSQFKVIDPGGKTVYRGVRLGPEKDDDGSSNQEYADPGWATFQLRPGTANRGFFYVPAPPENVTKLTFDGGEKFGQVPNVPIR